MTEDVTGRAEMVALIWGSSGSSGAGSHSVAAPEGVSLAGPLPSEPSLPEPDQLPPGQVEVPVAYLMGLQAQVADGQQARVESALGGGNAEIEALLVEAVADGRLVAASLPAWRRRLAEEPVRARADLRACAAVSPTGIRSTLAGRVPEGVVDTVSSRRPSSCTAPDGTVDIGGKWPQPRSSALSASMARHPASGEATEADWDRWTGDLMGLPQGQREELAARRAWGPDQWFDYSIGLNPNGGGGRR